MTRPLSGHDEIHPALLLRAYSLGAFPMADGRDGRLGWFSPDPRAIFPLRDDDPAGRAFHVSRSLQKQMRRGTFEVTRDRAFADVMQGCAEPREDDSDTWISPAIERVFNQLHELDMAHSLEAWQDGQLVGGIYGLSMGGAFFAESMFSRVSNASKVCLAHLVEHLQAQGYVLLDVQLWNPHLEQFGVVEIPHLDFIKRLQAALALDVQFSDSSPPQ